MQINKGKNKVRLELGGVRFLRERAGCPWKAGELWPWDRIGLLAGVVALDENDRPIRSAWYSVANEALTTGQSEVAIRLKRRARLRTERAKGYARLTWHKTASDWVAYSLIAVAFATTSVGMFVLVILRSVLPASLAAIMGLLASVCFAIAAYQARRAVCAAEFHADRLIIQRVDGSEETIAYDAITSGRDGFLV